MYIWIDWCMCLYVPGLVCMYCTFASLKVTAKKLYSHGDGANPVSREDSYEARENGWVNVVLHMLVVVFIAFESLDLMRKKVRELLEFLESFFNHNPRL